MAAHIPLVRRALESLASLLAPDVCAGCDARIGVFTVFCSTCARTLVPAAELREGELAAFSYGGALTTAIASLKYGGRVDRARPLSHLLLRAIGPLRDLVPAAAVVVPVPLHRARLALRGYNHAALLAAPVARALGARFAPGALVRTRDTPAQASLGRDARWRNVERAFMARPGARHLAGERVLVVDDVRTTGATLDACAIALRDAGAAEVTTLVLAVADGASNG
jgi:ComF family protein